MKIQIRLIIFIGLLLVISCRKPYVPVPTDYTEYAWTLYLEGKYSDALYWFDQAIINYQDYADGYNGKGWTQGKRGKADSAVVDFTTALTYIDSTDTSVLQYNIRAGRSFAYHAVGLYQSSIEDGLSVLDADSFWVFVRDTTANYKDIQIILAADYFGLGDFLSSLEWVQALDSTFSVDVIDPSGVTLLSEKIEELMGNI
jgi:tetratricopeptide (TPR) repeat protein